MKPKRDYDPAALGVEILTQPEAEAIVLDDAVPIFDNTEALKDQLKADKQHPAYGLDARVDEDD